MMKHSSAIRQRLTQLLVAAILALVVCTATACVDLTAPRRSIDISQCGELTPTRFALVYEHGMKRDTGQYFNNRFALPLRMLDTLITYGDGPTAVTIAIVRSPMTDSKCLTLADSMIYRSYDAVGYVGQR